MLVSHSQKKTNKKQQHKNPCVVLRKKKTEPVFNKILVLLLKSRKYPPLKTQGWDSVETYRTEQKFCPRAHSLEGSIRHSYAR